MKSGEIINARTHADFLNQAFGTTYKAWMKSVWRYDENTVVWMVRFGKEDGGWTNTFLSDTRIEEKILTPQSTVSPLSEYLYKKRVVIQVVECSYSRKYIFRGIYQYDEKNSDPCNVRYYDKLSDEF